MSDSTKAAPQSSYHILICLIETWKTKEGDDIMKVPSNPNMFAEVEEIEIEDTYKKLICGASVKFPRGTILHRTLTPTNGYVYDASTSASWGPDGIITETKNASPQGLNENNEKVTLEGSKLAQISDFAIGDRIRISLGYTTDPAVAAMTSYNSEGKSIFTDSNILKEYKSNLRVMFDGYITKVSLDTPIELECENLASVFKSITCTKRQGKTTDTVNTFLKEGDGCLGLLKDTGLELYPKTESANISLGRIDLVEDWVLADVFDQWAKRKVYTFVKRENEKAYLAVGRPYFSKLDSSKNDSLMTIAEIEATIPTIDFSWNVAKNGLTLMSTDKNFVAVDAQCLEHENGKEKFYRIVVIRNPKYDPDDSSSKPYRTVNEVKISKKGLKLGKKVMTSSKEKVSLDKYNVIPYMSRKVDCPHDELIDEAVKYLETYNPNGIDGSLTLFGDLYLTTGSKVKLVDDIHSGKNGYYFVEEVITKFGVNGFRQTIKMPYCISRDNEQ